ASAIERGLSAEAFDFVRSVAVRAQKRGDRVYLVGGVVRDLLLERQVHDLDILVLNDAVGLAETFAAEGALTVHRRFGTARLLTDGLTIDFTRARAESYPHPGTLPVVWPGNLADDLFRRDF